MIKFPIYSHPIKGRIGLLTIHLGYVLDALLFILSLGYLTANFGGCSAIQ